MNEHLVMVDWYEPGAPLTEVEAEPVHVTVSPDTASLLLPDGSILRARRSELLAALSEPESERTAA